MNSRAHIDTKIEFDYNSLRDTLLIPEYGRHIQKMISYIKTLPEKEKRQAYAEQIISMMLQILPQNKNLDDYKEKAWKHLFRIANYELDIDPPAGISIKRPGETSRPEIIDYPHIDTKYRHYGNHVQHLIDKAVSTEDKSIRDELVKVIGSYMKLAYKNWNKDHIASDEQIRQDIINMSKGKLQMDIDTSLDTLTNPSITQVKKKKRNSPTNHPYNNNNSRRNYKTKRRP